jgi:hypothetical protein
MAVVVAVRNKIVVDRTSDLAAAAVVVVITVVVVAAVETTGIMVAPVVAVALVTSRDHRPHR